MIKGKCTKCGSYCYGWALQNKNEHLCHFCEGLIEVVEVQSETIENDPIITSFDTNAADARECSHT